MNVIAPHGIPYRKVYYCVQLKQRVHIERNWRTLQGNHEKICCIFGGAFKVACLLARRWQFVCMLLDSSGKFDSSPALSKPQWIHSLAILGGRIFLPPFLSLSGLSVTIFDSGRDKGRLLPSGVKWLCIRSHARSSNGIDNMESEDIFYRQNLANY